MPMRESITWPEYLCVECGGQLARQEGALGCAECGEVYPVLLGTPRLLRRVLRERLLGEASVERPYGQAGSDVGATRAKLRTAASFGFEWERFSDLREEWERNFLEYMQPRDPAFFAGKRVLDAGCGTGRHAYYSARFGAEVVAVDLSDAIDVARRNTRDLGHVHTVQADLYDLPFAPESFDFIYSIGVLHHLPDPEGAFRSLLRFLKPGGGRSRSTSTGGPKDSRSSEPCCPQSPRPGGSQPACLMSACIGCPIRSQASPMQPSSPPIAFSHPFRAPRRWLSGCP